MNGGHASQHYDTPTIAKHYRDLHPIMKDAKHHLKQHTEYLKYCIHTTSEESDGIHSRTSSYSSADETDDEGLDAKSVSDLS